MQCGISMMRYVGHNGKAPTTALTVAVLQQQLQVARHLVKGKRTAEELTAHIIIRICIVK
eukprot:262840-Heterocapsa_arctica.AAC.1